MAIKIWIIEPKLPTCKMCGGEKLWRIELSERRKKSSTIDPNAFTGLLRCARCHPPKAGTPILDATVRTRRG